MLNIGSLMVDSLDHIMIVDKDYRVVYNTRFDEKLSENKQYCGPASEVGQNFLDIYPNLKREESSIVRCLETGQIVVKKHQETVNFNGRRYVSNNITFPIVRKGEIIAAVELAIDVDENAEDLADDVSNKIFDDFVFRLKRDAGKISFDSILTSNEKMKRTIEKAALLAELPNPVLIYGETGTGKEMFAQAMITHSRVPKNKVVTQNCAAVPENLIEAALFGTVRGAYTGAENKKGLFEEADGGILFLDELNSVPLTVQSKLLRILQEGTFMPLGSNKEKHVNVKVIAAMNIDPLKAIDDRIIRQDLFYRFSGGLISISPLRERREDIGLFAGYYTHYFAEMYGKSNINIDPELKKALTNYDWPGNVRELKNVIESMMVYCKPGDTLGLSSLPDYLKPLIPEASATSGGAGAAGGSEQENAKLQGISGVKNAGGENSPAAARDEFVVSEDGHIHYQEIMDGTEKKLIEKALEATNGNKSRAAELLGLPRQTLKYRIEKLEIKIDKHE